MHVTEVREPEQLAVPVAGGDLSVLHWPAADARAPLVVLVHGITANAMAWERVASALGDEFDVVAPDLRGRGGSARLPGPYGIETHADDVTALLHRSGADDGRTVVLVGHSMGAFVAAMAAAGPARGVVHGLVMVDGGLALPQPPGADLDAMLSALLGPALDRLAMTFPDLAAVRAFWERHPAVGPWVDVPSVAAYLARDLLRSEPPHLHSSCVPEAVRVDGGDVLVNERVLEATTALPVRATLLWASRGLLDQSPGLYDDARLDQLGAAASGITTREVPDTNHYSILWARHGVDAVAAAVRDAARSPV
jgi:pimeloyl-ACP methyl ester carboxylesterase